MSMSHDRIGKISINGGVAYKEGTLAGECPYLEDDPDFQRWNDEWDAAADEHESEGPPKVGSVVTNRYRALYSESGHPTHCGDDLVCSDRSFTSPDPPTPRHRYRWRFSSGRGVFLPDPTKIFPRFKPSDRLMIRPV